MNDLSDLLTPLLAKHNVPSLAAAVVFGNEIRAAGAVGVRKRGDPTPVTLTDKYHVGSCAKAMTATLAGILVERNLIFWDSTIQSVFPELSVHPSFQAVTLKQLLTHTGGFPKDPHDALWEEIWEADGSAAPREQRLNLVLPGLLSRPLGYETDFLYSNAGYTVAGTMLERAADRPFEELLQDEVFGPLGVTSAGFGAPATPGRVDQPYGHTPEPVDPEPHGDNPQAIAPAGTVHMSITDFAKHASFHLTGEPELVGRETFELLHTPLESGYALGWSVGQRKWAGGLGLNHSGSNTTFFALTGLAPVTNSAVVCAANLGTGDGETACIALFQALTKQYL